MSITDEISLKLDGNLTQQEAEARGLNEYHEWLLARYKWYAPYCSISDLDHLWNMEAEYGQSLLPIRERIANRERESAIFAKMPLDAIAQSVERHLVLSRKKAIKHRGYELGAREFTLTYSPKWMDDAQAREEMIKAMNKLCKYYEGSIIKLRAVGEVGSNGLSHIHCFYKLEGGLKITDKNFQRAWKYWNPKKPLGRGFEGGHHATVKEESDFLGYIEKDIETSWHDQTISKPEA